MDNRVFWAVLCALLVFSGICWLGWAFLFAASSVAVANAQRQAADRASVVAQQASADIRRDQQQRAAYASWIHERGRLQPDQRRVGGVVIEQHGSTFTQVGYPGQPAHCSGQYADQPMR